MEMLASQELVGASWSGALPADILDLPTGWEAGPWARLVQASAVLSGQRWMLVGGLMVASHAIRSGIGHVRPTTDVDVVVELGVEASPSTAVATLATIGYRPKPPLDGGSPFHRLVRGTDVLDVMTTDRSTTARFGPLPWLAVPGSSSAAGRCDDVQLIDHREDIVATIRIPDLASALSLKGAAYRADTRDRDRHLEDALVLLAIASNVQALTMSKSMRAHTNDVIAGLDDPAPWQSVAPVLRARALAAIRVLRPDWNAPASVRGSLGRPGAQR